MVFAGLPSPSPCPLTPPRRHELKILDFLALFSLKLILPRNHPQWTLQPYRLHLRWILSVRLVTFWQLSGLAWLRTWQVEEAPLAYFDPHFQSH